MTNMKRKKMWWNNDKYEKNENVMNQWQIWKERKCDETMTNMKRKKMWWTNDKYEKKENAIN